MNKSYLSSIKNTALSSKPSTTIRLLLMVLFVSIMPLVSFGQSQTFSTPGTFVAPAGVTSVTVECWGAGGAGGMDNEGPANGGGGGGGGYSKSTSVSVVAGTSYTITVGTGGLPSVNNGNGGASIAALVSSVTAYGGTGGTASFAGEGGAGGVGTTFRGGDGADGLFGNYGGGGGGSAGTTANGTTATTATGATAVIGGGSGGNGSTNGNGSSPASGIGGGGGGGRSPLFGSNRSGGNGANGQVKISWTCPTYSLTGSNTTTSTCVSVGTSTITLKGTAGSLPVGTYTVTYNTDIPYQSGKTATMTVSTAGTGTFTATGLTIYSGASGTSTVTVTNIASGTCSNAVSSNNTAGVTVFANSVGGNVDYATTPICINTATTLTLSGSTGSVVQWEKRVNGGSWTIITNTTTTLTETPSSSGTWEYRVLVGNGSCSSVYSASRSVVVNPALTITLASTNATVCQNTTTASLSYSATTGSPAQWQVDFDAAANTAGFGAMQTGGLAAAPGTILLNVPFGVAAGVYNGNLKLITYTPSCSGTTSYPITITVNPKGVAGVSIAASPSGAICSGTSVTFTATPTNGGTTPIYQWKLNGTNVGTNSATYTNSSLANGNTVTCVMTSSSTCVTGSPATSGTITMSVNPSLAASVAIAASPSGAICSGTSVTFTSTPTNGGTTPTYQWYNGVMAISGATSATYTTTTLANSDVIKVIMTSNASPCVSGSPATSNSLTATIIVSPVISGTVTPATCSNVSDGAITVTGLNVPIEFKKADNDYIDLGSKFLSNRNAFTVEGWVKFNLADVGSRMSLFGQNDVVEFFLDTNTILLWTPGGGSVSTPLTAAIGNNAWHHIAATGDGTNLRIYIDGGLVATGGSTTTNYGNSTAYNVQIGSGVVDPLTPAGGGFTGQIGKVGFYNTALAAGTISTLATSPTTYLGTETGLIAGYNFFEGSGTALSKLPAGTNGTFGNSPQWAYTAYTWTKTGTPSYTASTKNISGLSPGDYNLTISTLGGCPITKTFTVGSTNTLSSAPTVTPTQPTCSVSTGTITVNTPLAATGITYTVTGTNPVVAAVTNATGVFSNLSVGTYDVTTTNACGTSTATSVTLEFVTNTWNGSAWSNGTPNSNQKIVFSGNYPPAVDLDADIITGCSCIVTGGIAVTIKSGKTLAITNEVKVLGTLTFEDTSSLVQTNDAAINSGNIIYKRTTSSVLPSDYTYWSSPVANQNLGISPSYVSGMFYSYNDFAVPEDWKGESASTVMLVGKGYIIRGPQTISPPGLYKATFTGVPNNGIKTIPIGPTGTGNLLGNPYPSAINADTFLATNNALIEGTIYFWTHNTAIQLASNITNGTAGSGVLAYTSDDYASYNGTGGVAVSGGIVPTGKIAAGQAFFTISKAIGGSVAFNNAMRLAGTTVPDKTGVNQQFFKTKSSTKKTGAVEKNRVWLNLTNTKGAFKQTLVGYVTNATNEYDSRFDGESFDGNEFVDFYSINQDKSLVIQGRALPFDENDQVPLGYRTTISGTFSINIGQVDGVLANQSVFLEDKLTNTVFNLKNGKYTFDTAAGTFDDRFVLKYSDKTLATNDFDATVNQVVVSVKNKQIKINSFVETIDKVAFYDLSGKQIYKKDNVNDSELLITDFVSSHQVLVVKTILQNGKMVTDKIIY